MRTRSLAALACLQVAAGLAAAQSPPVARTIPRVDTLNGDVRVDNYFWLREKQNPEVRTYLEAENAYTATGMQHTEALQEQIYRELLGRIKETDLSVPYRQGGFWYYKRTEQGKSYPIYCRRPGALDAPEQVILDQNALALGKRFDALGGFDVSPDGRLLMYLEDTTAFRVYTLYVKDLPSGRIIDSIANVWNGTAWADDNRTFFYMTADSAKRGNAVWRHVLGTLRSTDVKVFQEDNVLNNVTVFRSRSGKYVFIPADGFTSSEWRVIPTANPTADARVIAPRRAGVEYEIDHGDGFFFLYTNDNARNFKIVRIPEADFSPAGWTDWLSHRDSVFVEGVDVFRRFAVVSERSGGLRRLRVTNLQTNQSQYVTFPEAAYGVFPANNPEFDTETFRFSYSSLVTPNSVYDYDLRRGTRELKKRQEIPSGFDASRYEVRRLMARARDGVLVPRHCATSQRLVAKGGSAGGLLMGAVVNMRRDLFRAVVADVPFVDVINTMLDASLPLTAQEWEQWGNPRIPEQYAYMRQYSPYDNVAAKAYPWMLVTTSFNDSQVMYWEPAKWVAKLRATKTDHNPLYFKINLAGGHGGSSGRYDRLREIAFRYAFMLDAVGLAAPATGG